jgi:hypothetical protein
MAAPTNAAKREKALANPEPSTHGRNTSGTLKQTGWRFRQGNFAIA